MKEAILDAVRQQLEALEAPFRAQAGSALDGLEDVVGSTEGPEDLSENREYLRGYGR